MPIGQWIFADKVNGKHVLDEGGRNDDTGSKVPSEEIHVDVDSQVLIS